MRQSLAASALRALLLLPVLACATAVGDGAGAVPPEADFVVRDSAVDPATTGHGAAARAPEHPPPVTSTLFSRPAKRDPRGRVLFTSLAVGVPSGWAGVHPQHARPGLAAVVYAPW